MLFCREASECLFCHNRMHSSVTGSSSDWRKIHRDREAGYLEFGKGRPGAPRCVLQPGGCGLSPPTSLACISQPSSHQHCDWQIWPSLPCAAWTSRCSNCDATADAGWPCGKGRCGRGERGCANWQCWNYWRPRRPWVADGQVRAAYCGWEIYWSPCMALITRQGGYLPQTFCHLYTVVRWFLTTK